MVNSHLAHKFTTTLGVYVKTIEPALTFSHRDSSAINTTDFLPKFSPSQTLIRISFLENITISTLYKKASPKANFNWRSIFFQCLLDS
ncbi:protein of unknown function [Streptococcus thermophilus]|nr:protein of unknown function [Streptococcus thermophilus]CAD0145984.1 protein of unknown function [Streptococcus thermophilus]CAD0146941.1 protein of unknown function [Streptococcus thermophilus]CAD0151108.1 protein of unknown function [Streptococcus thermophilus]